MSQMRSATGKGREKEEEEEEEEEELYLRGLRAKPVL